LLALVVLAPRATSATRTPTAVVGRMKRFFRRSDGCLAPVPRTATRVVPDPKRGQKFSPPGDAQPSGGRGQAGGRIPSRLSSHPGSLLTIRPGWAGIGQYVTERFHARRRPTSHGLCYSNGRHTRPVTLPDTRCDAVPGFSRTPEASATKSSSTLTGFDLTTSGVRQDAARVAAQQNDGNLCFSEACMDASHSCFERGDLPPGLMTGRIR
jgi:hypothetical protein